LGAGCAAHFLPFQCSARTRWPGAVCSDPVAVQSEDDGHDTPFSSLLMPGRFGVVWGVHVWPFHRSATVVTGKVLVVSWYPIAVQASGDEHDTALRKVSPEGSGMR